MESVKFVDNNSAIFEKDIEYLEKKLGVLLPLDYKEFLLEYNGGNVYYNSFQRPLSATDEQDKCLDYFESIEGVMNAWDNLKDYEEFIIAKVIPIAQTLSNAFIGIGFGEENLGNIFVFDWDFGVTFQANTLKDFFKQINYAEDGIDYPLF